MDTDFSKLYIENQVCFPLYAASRLITKVYEPFLRELDITYPQYLVMMVLWENNNLSVNEIGNQLLLESNTLTPLLKRLEQRKLIIRKRSGQDERKVVVSLTQEGAELKNRAVTVPDQIVSAISSESFSTTEMASFQQTLKKLVLVLREKLADRSPV